ncbi:hypothetical protein [Actinomadura sp. WAC 06369]|uniref:hypothetical protein n=1 Tax=Actinomadura sp. WAC 06369 TaxID=2203193 RepID=UPI000F78CA86|nr:hypothetical protein [Actinomadura sp. WAC 06369]RSN67185.1 hypothetical protein DMH08_14095 [Actinomadura sp. WAC 06369]
MSTVVMVVIAVIIVAAAVAAVAFLGRTRARTRRLRRRFGPEYDRAVQRHGGRAAAEEDLLGRERKHRELELRELEPQRREEFRARWVGVQERFVDAPVQAVEEADDLVRVVMGERGYPTRGFEDQIAHLSVEHARTLDHYRSAHTIGGKAAAGEASTEELRQAMVHYRALFEDLLRAPGEDRRAAPAAPAGEAVAEPAAGPARDARR